ncbi:MAG: hypothetical protein Q7S32_02500 [bacterium]|nr:hypothetical protein [bacterium]
MLVIVYGIPQGVSSLQLNTDFRPGLAAVIAEAAGPDVLPSEIDIFTPLENLGDAEYPMQQKRIFVVIENYSQYVAIEDAEKVSARIAQAVSEKIREFLFARNCTIKCIVRHRPQTGLTYDCL